MPRPPRRRMIDLARPGTWRAGARALPYRHELRALALDRGRLIRLSPVLVTILAVLLRHEVAAHELILSQVYGSKAHQPDNERGCLSVHLMRLRDCLAPAGFVVVNLFGHGYRLQHDPVAAAERVALFSRRRTCRLQVQQARGDGGELGRLRRELARVKRELRALRKRSPDARPGVAL